MSKKSCVDCGTMYYGSLESELCDECINEIDKADEEARKLLTSYKAIAELAVKALEEISNGVEWNWETYADTASDALSEINRLRSLTP
jgi:hypothetical protein